MGGRAKYLIKPIFLYNCLPQSYPVYFPEIKATEAMCSASSVFPAATALVGSVTDFYLLAE